MVREMKEERNRGRRGEKEGIKEGSENEKKNK